MNKKTLIEMAAAPSARAFGARDDHGSNEHFKDTPLPNPLLARASRREGEDWQFGNNGMMPPFKSSRHAMLALPRRLT